MAYGSRVNYGWVNAWSNGYYAVDVYLKYQQDVINNKTKVILTNQRVRSLNGYYSFYNYSGVNNGYGFQNIGGSYVDVNDPVSVSGGGTWTHSGDRECSVERTHNASGAFPATQGVCQFISGTGAPNAPEFDWKGFNIPTLPSIDRSAGTNSLSLVSRTRNSITCKYTSSVATNLIQYSLDGTNWYDTGVDISTGGNSVNFTLSGLSQNTSYTVRVRHRRDYNQVYSGSKSITTTTLKPDAPTKGSISVTSASPTSIVASASGFSFGAGGTYGNYQFKKSTDSNWTNKGQTKTHTFSGLSPNTKYTLQCRLVDNYGTASSAASVDYTTPKPSAPNAGTLSLTSKTSSSIKITASGYSATSPATISEYKWKIGNGDWSSGDGNSATFTELEPNTKYTIQFKVIDNYGTESSVKQIEVTTDKPEAPSITSFTAGTITGYSIQLNFNGSYGSDYPSEYQSDGEFVIEQLVGQSWVEIARVPYSTKTYDVTGLLEETQYQFRVKLVDHYDTASDASTVTATTLFVGIRCYVKTGTVAEYGIVHIKVGSQVVRATGMWVKHNGQLEEI